jgi:hypothetical protein
VGGRRRAAIPVVACRTTRISATIFPLSEDEDAVRYFQQSPPDPTSRRRQPGLVAPQLVNELEDCRRGRDVDRRESARSAAARDSTPASSQRATITFCWSQTAERFRSAGCIRIISSHAEPTTHSRARANCRGRRYDHRQPVAGHRAPVREHEIVRDAHLRHDRVRLAFFGDRARMPCRFASRARADGDGRAGDDDPTRKCAGVQRREIARFTARLPRASNPNMPSVSPR